MNVKNEEQKQRAAVYLGKSSVDDRDGSRRSALRTLDTLSTAIREGLQHAPNTLSLWCRRGDLNAPSQRHHRPTSVALSSPQPVLPDRQPGLPDQEDHSKRPARIGIPRVLSVFPSSGWWGRRLSGGKTGSIHLEMQDVGTRVVAGRIEVLALASNLA